MLFKKSNSMNISVLPEQEKQLSSKEKILANCQNSNVIAFDIYDDDILIGFAMLKEYEQREYFLWNYAIDKSYQNKGYGTKALTELINMMCYEYNMHIMTTTYIYGNDHAKHIYEKLGFTETDVVDEDDCHEVNMIYHCK